MPRRVSVLCPIDFSAASLGALRYAAAIAERFDGELTVMTVEDPLLASMDAAAGESWHGGETRRELSRVVSDVLGRRSGMLSERLEVASGRPAEEILRLVNERPCDLVVMSTHGLTGRRRLFFGATTERVLRSATVPVLVTRPDDPGPVSADQIGVLVNRILVPVDLDGSAPHTVHVAAGLAPVFKAPLLVVHVVEPARLPFPRRGEAPRLDRERRAEADQALDAIAEEVLPGVVAETLVAYGDAPEEIAKIAHDRHAGLIVMPIRGEGESRIGAVAYRVLSLAPALVLALPGSVAAQRKDEVGLGAAALAVC
jgi:nucleotide-binding universal stress UspA family protein